MNQRYITFALFAAAVTLCKAQSPDAAQAYKAWKLTQIQHPHQSSHPAASPAATGELRGGAPCACWITPDASYTTISDTSGWDAGGYDDSDDGSFGPITLPFSFQFYGTAETIVYININGSLSFGTDIEDFSATGFPVTDYAMVSPFWADVDLSYLAADTNLVSYKLTSTALYVTWTKVGYYSENVDKLNSFQVIISNGIDPAIPGGNNVSFCYGTMLWTTGDASDGTDGFGGSPAVAGVNEGDGTNYLQLGRFDHAGTDWDGPFGNADGVGWLSDRHFSFSTASANVSPIFMGTNCDTLSVEVGSSYIYPGWTPAGIASLSSSRSITLQPNPANDKVTLSWATELRPTLIQVIAMDGSLVMARAPEIGTKQMQLDVSNLAPGIYTMRLAGPSGVSRARLVR